MSQFSYTEFEKRPWGSYFVIHDEKNYKVKRIEVLPGKRLSYQYHEKRSEASKHQLEEVGKGLREMMPFLNAKDVKKDK